MERVQHAPELAEDRTPAAPAAHPPDDVTDGDSPVGGLPGDGRDEAAVGRRAARTREAIAEASRRLFLDRGYAGTRIANITDACGISRAGFYTYFKDKRAVFNYIGQQTYQDLLAVIGLWDSMPDPVSTDDVAGWVRRYFAFLDVHGAFILSSAQSAPSDDDFRASARRMQMRVGWLLGTALRSRQARPADAPEALGFAVVGAIERGWYHSRAQDLPLDDEDMIRTLARIVLDTLEAGTA